MHHAVFLLVIVLYHYFNLVESDVIVGLQAFNYTDVLSLGIFHLSLEICEHPIRRLNFGGIAVDLHFPYVIERHRTGINKDYSSPPHNQ